MIRGLGAVTATTYSQTFEIQLARLEVGHVMPGFPVSNFWYAELAMWNEPKAGLRCLK